MCKIIIVTFYLLLAVPVAAQDFPADPAEAMNKDSLLNTEMDELLNYLMLTRDDFRFRDDYTAKDPYRLKIVDSLMKNPLLMDDFADGLEQKFKAGKAGYVGALDGLFEGYGDDVRFDSIFNQGLINTQNYIGQIENLLNNAFNFEKAENSYYKDDALLAFIKNKYQELILDDPDYRVFSNEQLDSIQQLEEDYTKYFADEAADCLVREFGHGYNVMDEVIKDINIIYHSDIYKDVLSRPDTIKGKFGPIIIGTYGNDVYEGEYYMIIDPGGNDIYHLTYDIDNPHPTLIADFAGDDYYTAESDFALACGALAHSILVDYDGDDVYRGGNFSLGAGYFGVGILIDKKGNDSYFGDTFTQGAGTFGLGLLIDEDGSDTYSGNLYCQGMGFVRGIGGLVDYTGNDNYIVQARYKEFFHSGDHYQSLSQGFAIGLRPHMSGGFGFIFDFSGNDSYLADFFAQGSSYWWSLGLLYDKAGNDVYTTYQYAQGAGAHMALGLLLDGAGDDIYRSHGVCQGCGHDYSCGWLLDRGGNDMFSANDLAQGGGQANGIGIFTNLFGDDGYYVFSKANTQGYGNPRRDYGSIGLFLDIGGDDRYYGNGEQKKSDNFWMIPSKWGGGLDKELPTTDSTEAPR